MHPEANFWDGEPEEAARPKRSGFRSPTAPWRTDLSREFGATDVVSARGEKGVAQVRELADGTHVVLEAVGNMPAYQQAVGVARPGGVISRVASTDLDGVPAGYQDMADRKSLKGLIKP